MGQRASLLAMLRQLLEDLLEIQQAGAGYYSCIPFVHRYNKLLGVARGMLGDGTLIATFEDLEERDPKDPADKMKVIQGIRMEIGQLISLIESLGEEEVAAS